jgi:hypothetical protein
MISESGTEANPLAASRTKFVLNVSGALASAPQSEREFNDFFEYFMCKILSSIAGGLAGDALKAHAAAERSREGARN